MIKTYYLLTKPGIIIGNLITTIAGFALASQGHFQVPLFFATMLGLGAVIASACVFNNYIDRDADEKMERTKNRPLVTKAISNKSAILFALFLGVVGIGILARYTNFLTVCVALVGFVVYVALYSFWKYRTNLATLVGSISGGVPLVVGYCAVSGRIDMGALLLFAMIVLWQMPHFYSIAVYRMEEYAKASIPVLPIAKGIYVTKVQMLLYIMAFIVSCILLTIFGYTGYVYMGLAVPLGLSWLALCIHGFKGDNDKKWARKMFSLSLFVITSISVMISVDAFTRS